MACKRSAVRARLAPQVRSEIRTNRTGSTAAKYSNGGRLGRRTCVRIGIFPRAGLLAGQRIPDAEPALSAFHLRKSPRHRSRYSCRLVTARPSWRAISACDCCRICKWPSGAGHRGGPVHSQEARLPARARVFADGRLGVWARRIAPIVSVGAGPTGALRRSGAGSLRGATLRAVGAPVRHLRNQARRSARDVAGCQASGDPVMALTLPTPCPWRPSMAGWWRCAATRLTACRSLVASSANTSGKRYCPGQVENTRISPNLRG